MATTIQGLGLSPRRNALKQHFDTGSPAGNRIFEVIQHEPPVLWWDS